MSTFDLQPLSQGGDGSLPSQGLLPSGNFGVQESTTVTVTSIVQSSTAPAATGGNTPGPNSGASGNSANATASANISPSPDNRNGSDSSDGNRTTVIVLSTVLSVVGVILVVGAAFLCLRCRRRRSKLFRRGITPIDDDEIETWKNSSRREKELGDDAVLSGYGDNNNGHVKHDSVSSTRKSTSVIVYSNARRSEERSPRSPRSQFQHGKRSLDGRKISLDKELPQTPIQARAPNAREGLTDDAVPGDDPFIHYPKRQTSRLCKTPPSHPQQPRHAHTRTRSSFSLRSLGDHIREYDSEVELTPRTSHDYHEYQGRRSNDQRPRVFSSSSIPPRLSMSNDWPGSPQVRQDMIGRAIG